MKVLRNSILAAGAALVLAASSLAQTSTWTIDPAHSGVNFQIRHLGVSNVRGSFGKVTGTVVWDEKDATKSKVEATIDATTVNTGVEARDNHLKGADFFDVAKNPTLVFKSTAVKKLNGKLVVIGDLTLAGVTKSVTLDVDGPAAPQPGRGGKTLSGFSASGTISRKDFNFGSKYSAPMLGDDVKFTIDLEVSK